MYLNKECVFLKLDIDKIFQEINKRLVHLPCLPPSRNKNGLITIICTINYKYDTLKHR